MSGLVMAGVIDRRILVNYRIDPEIAAAQLPAPFRPKVIQGVAIAGLCLIRLRSVRPRGLPAWCGLSSENAAHRMAVEWDEDGVVREGVFVQRRETNSRLNAFAGGRLFPGLHGVATFEVRETGRDYDVGFRALDGSVRVRVVASQADAVPASSVFGSLTEASDFFRGGSVGYSPAASPGRQEGLELRCERWSLEPLRVTLVRSSYFEDQGIFPPGSIALDSAFLMRGIPHEWHTCGTLCCPDAESVAAAG